MDAALIVVIVILAIIGIAVIWLWAIYNSLVRTRQRVRESWSGIDVQLKRRSSLIPNLVETVKGYAQHERQTLDSVTQARSMLMSAGSPG